MTTEPISEPVGSSGDSPPPIEPSEPNPILGEITRLNQDEGTVDTTPDDGDSSEQAQPEQATPDQPVAEAPVAEEPAPETEAPQQQPQEQQPQYTPQQLQQLQFQAQQYQQQQSLQTLQNQAAQYQKQLENQGFLPEHAQQAAYDYMQSSQRQADLVKQAEEYGQHLQGQMLAAEHFATKYKLNITDQATLRNYGDMATMEDAAKKIAADRERDAELTRLRQAQVPAQQFDNSQGEPSVAPNDNGWLDRYNSGDRSPNSVAAARRATGLE